MYADTITKSMQQAIDETNRRREIQTAYNAKHHITPTSIEKKIEESTLPKPTKSDKKKLDIKKIPKDEYPSIIKDLTSQMDLAAANLEFEKAAELRDIIEQLKKSG